MFFPPPPSSSALLRQLVYNQRRPHCCAIVREGSHRSEQQAELELQAILHDISIRPAAAGLLEQMTRNSLGSNMDKARRSTWSADGGLDHLAIWHLFANGRMEELDYTW